MKLSLTLFNNNEKTKREIIKIPLRPMAWKFEPQERIFLLLKYKGHD
jgi:hypothetical protein